MSPRKHKLSAARIKQFQKRLEEERDRLRASLARMDTRGDELVDLGSDEADFDDAASDAATETLDRGTDMALEENLRTLLEEVEAALEKIARGSYGVCDNCGGDIKIARLERIPSATMCVECQERLERR
ncbi:MAG: TraR/DksA family transcriptional regulator [Candidatus Zipacnadales bacterium]